MKGRIAGWLYRDLNSYIKELLKGLIYYFC
jgi:hypothetical protein